MTLRAVELFAGVGGLAMGVGLAGFESLAVVEWNKSACETLRLNQARKFPLVEHWAVSESDVRTVDWGAIPENIELLAGGPPCQPFSMGGKHKAHDDSRDMFPSAVDIVRKLQPQAFIFENVKGLTRASFANYYQYILLQLEFPEMPRRKREEWFTHLMRLQGIKTSRTARSQGLSYNVVPTLINSADFGVPQKRERVFIVGFRSDLEIDWRFPLATHSEDALLRDQWVTGNYWERHRVAVKQRPAPPLRYGRRIRDLRQEDFAGLMPWRTVRDALEGLPEPWSPAAVAISDHSYQEGAKVYAGHTGSPLDQPSKTIKAGDHGVPGGENMLVYPDGTVRYFSAREAARIQTFPDGFVFNGSWSETMRQLGNAVPVALARIVASSVAQSLIEAQFHALTHRTHGKALAA